MADFYDALREIFQHNESSDYGGVNPNDNGALSLGLLQWHAARALGLMRMIADEPGGSAEIESELGSDMLDTIQNGSNNVWNTYVIPSSLVSNFRNVLTSAPGVSAQDKLFSSDTAGYVSQAKSLGITETGAQLYFCDLYNQSPKQALNIARACQGVMTLDNLYQQSLANNVMGKYANRRTWTYNYCLSYTGGGSGVTPPVNPPPDNPNDSGQGDVSNVSNYILALDDGSLLLEVSDNFPNGRLYMQTSTGLYVPKKSYSNQNILPEV